MIKIWTRKSKQNIQYLLTLVINGGNQTNNLPVPWHYPSWPELRCRWSTTAEDKWRWRGWWNKRWSLSGGRSSTFQSCCSVMDKHTCLRSHVGPLPAELQRYIDLKQLSGVYCFIPWKHGLSFWGKVARQWPLMFIVLCWSRVDAHGNNTTAAPLCSKNGKRRQS